MYLISIPRVFIVWERISRCLTYLEVLWFHILVCCVAIEWVHTKYKHEIGWSYQFSIEIDFRFFLLYFHFYNRYAPREVNGKNLFKFLIFPA